MISWRAVFIITVWYKSHSFKIINGVAIVLYLAVCVIWPFIRFESGSG